MKHKRKKKRTAYTMKKIDEHLFANTSLLTIPSIYTQRIGAQQILKSSPSNRSIEIKLFKP